VLVFAIEAGIDGFDAHTTGTDSSGAKESSIGRSAVGILAVNGRVEVEETVGGGTIGDCHGEEKKNRLVIVLV
jgi:hypothetical protein